LEEATHQSSNSGYIAIYALHWEKSKHSYLLLAPKNTTQKLPLSSLGKEGVLEDLETVTIKGKFSLANSFVKINNYDYSL